MLGGCVTTVTSRSARPVFRNKSSDVASTMSFALPACNCGVVFTPAVKLSCLGSLRFFRREDRIPRAILLNKGAHTAHSARIMHLHSDRSRLAERSQGSRKSNNRGS